MSSYLSPRLALLLLVAAILLAYAPVLTNGFVNWEDPISLLGNQRFRGLDGSHLRWMFTTFQNACYQPLGWLAFAVIYKLRGMSAAAFHGASLLIHLAAASAAYVAALRIFRLIKGIDAPAAALVAALIFALHPLQVESVASAALLPSLLCGFFSIAALAAYLEGWLIASWIFSAAAALSHWKGVAIAVILPALDVYPLKRLSLDPKKWITECAQRKVLREKLPWILLSLLIVALYVAIKTSDDPRKGFSLDASRACAGFLFYLGKFFWPTKLLPIYVLGEAGGPTPWPSVLLMAALLAALVLLRKRFPAGLTVGVCLATALLPTLALTKEGPLFANDRYMYLPVLGLSLLAAGSLAALSRRALWLALPVALALAALTRSEIAAWRSPSAFWDHVLAAGPSSPFAPEDVRAFLSDPSSTYGALVYAQGRLRLYHLSPENDFKRNR